MLLKAFPKMGCLTFCYLSHNEVPKVMTLNLVPWVLERWKEERPENKVEQNPESNNPPKAATSETLFPSKRRNERGDKCKLQVYQMELRFTFCVINQVCLVSETKGRIFSRGKKAGNDGSILLAAHW